MVFWGNKKSFVSGIVDSSCEINVLSGGQKKNDTMESKNYIVMFGLPYFPCGMLVCGRQGGLYAMFKVKERKDG